MSAGERRPYRKADTARGYGADEAQSDALRNTGSFRCCSRCDGAQAIGTDLVAPERRGPEYLERFVASEIDKWAAPIRASGISVD